MADRLLVDLGADGLVTVCTWPEGGLPETVSRAGLVWPLDEGALEGLHWYLEDYLRAPLGAWEERGPQIQARLAGWGPTNIPAQAWPQPPLGVRENRHRLYMPFSRPPPP